MQFEFNGPKVSIIFPHQAEQILFQGEEVKAIREGNKATLSSYHTGSLYTSGDLSWTIPKSPFQFVFPMVVVKGRELIFYWSHDFCEKEFSVAVEEGGKEIPVLFSLYPDSGSATYKLPEEETRSEVGPFLLRFSCENTTALTLCQSVKLTSQKPWKIKNMREEEGNLVWNWEKNDRTQPKKFFLRKGEEESNDWSLWKSFTEVVVLGYDGSQETYSLLASPAIFNVWSAPEENIPSVQVVPDGQDLLIFISDFQGRYFYADDLLLPEEKEIRLQGYTQVLISCFQEPSLVLPTETKEEGLFFSSYLFDQESFSRNKELCRGNWDVLPEKYILPLGYLPPADGSLKAFLLSYPSYPQETWQG